MSESKVEEGLATLKFIAGFAAMLNGLDNVAIVFFVLGCMDFAGALYHAVKEIMAERPTP